MQFIIKNLTTPNWESGRPRGAFLVRRPREFTKGVYFLEKKEQTATSETKTLGTNEKPIISDSNFGTILIKQSYTTTGLARVQIKQKTLGRVGRFHSNIPNKMVTVLKMHHSLKIQPMRN